MESEDRKLVMSLANNYTDYTNEVLAIFKTNAMTISPMEAGLYPWVCRANHSCSPKLPKVTVRALRVIPVQLLFSQEFIHESKTEKKGDTVVIRFTLKFTQRS